jgi:CheY-like chemotaxis protein
VARPHGVGKAPGDVTAIGTETILLTEDEAGVRELVQAVLEGSGYRVLPASGLIEAVALAEGWKESIDALVSDIVMPGGTGLDLARQLKTGRPDLKVLFISGYPEHDGPALDPTPGVAFLAKPFTRAMLLQKLRENLD